MVGAFHTLAETSLCFRDLNLRGLARPEQCEFLRVCDAFLGASPHNSATYVASTFRFGVSTYCGVVEAVVSGDDEVAAGTVVLEL
jgi:hypothetical protein